MATDTLDANIFTHPAFNRPPVSNVRRPGRKAGTVSLAAERRRRTHLADITPDPLTLLGGAQTGDYKAGNSSEETETVQAALRMLEARLRVPGAPMESPQAVRAYLRLHMAELNHEIFAVLFLDAQLQLLKHEELFQGTLTQTSVYPREVVKRALHWHASAVILAHNHPSGLAEPSRADELLTQTLKNALALVDVRVLDHMVVGHRDVVSFAERGLL
jgi:DNA repair protein RadC